MTDALLRLIGDKPHMVIVAPHPDDEIFALGGTCALASKAGLRLTILAVTDGEASHSRSKLITATELAERRNQEVDEAYRTLDIRAERSRLCLPDGGVSHDALEDVLRARLSPEMTVFAPLSDDGHPDHNACGAVAKAVAAEAGCRFYAYPVWAYHRRPIGDGPGRRHEIPLPPEVHSAKLTAMDCFRSQFLALGPLPEDGPVLKDGFREPFSRDFEVVYA